MTTPDRFTHRRCGQRVAEVPPMDEHQHDEGLMWCARCGMYVEECEVEPEVVEEAEAFDPWTGPMPERSQR